MFVGLAWWRVKKAEEEKLRTENGNVGVKVEGEEGSVLGDLTRAEDHVFCVWLLVSTSVIRGVALKTWKFPYILTIYKKKHSKKPFRILIYFLLILLPIVLFLPIFCFMF